MKPSTEWGLASRFASLPQDVLASLHQGFSLSKRRLGRLVGAFSDRSRAEAGDIVAQVVEHAHALLSVRGEASGIMLAQTLLSLYGQMDADEKAEFFEALATQFNPEQGEIESAWQQYRTQGVEALPGLALAVEAPRQELFRRLNMAPGGTAALVRMRADMQPLRAKTDIPFDVLDADLKHLFQSWFNRGFLNMVSIDWWSPAGLLEKIIEYEAVHHISSWGELRRRLDPEDRRCYAFFHPCMPGEPLIFVEVALTEAIPDNIANVLDPDREIVASTKASTATFYSISNCQPGLRGISFGHFLIKQVAEDLKRELSNLKSFVTLSPIPGLMEWMDKSLTGAKDRALIERIRAADSHSKQSQEVRDFLLGHAVTYFTEARNAAGMPRDSVARFHLGNGARLERLNWAGDTSPKGIRQSGGLMVNYLYDLPTVEDNHEAYVNRSAIVTGAPFRKLAKSLADQNRA